MNAYEARELTQASQISGLYQEIEEAAKNGLYTVMVPSINNKEYKQLIADGYRIFVEHGTEQITQYHEDLMHDYDCIIIDWSEK